MLDNLKTAAQHSVGGNRANEAGNKCYTCLLAIDGCRDVTCTVSVLYYTGHGVQCGDWFYGKPHGLAVHSRHLVDQVGTVRTHSPPVLAYVINFTQVL